MKLFLTVFEIVAPVILLASIGFAWVRLGFEYRIEFVTRLTMSLSVPCLIFVSLMNTDIAPQALSAVSLATVVAYGLVTLLFALFIAVAKLDRRTYLAPLIFGNTGNLGLPLALFAFGQDGLSLAVVIFAIMAIFSFTFGVWLVSGGSTMGILKEPLVGATILGAIFLICDWQTPPVLTRTLELTGQIAIPMMLMTLGVAAARLKFHSVARTVAISSLKVVICAISAWVAGHWLALDPVAFAVLILQLATPVAVTSYLLAEKSGADSEAVAGLVVVSTLMSIGYIPLILAFVL